MLAVVSMPPTVGVSRFADRVVLITGAGNGIGLACALRTAAEGAHVVVTDSSTDSAEGVLPDLAGPGRHTAMALDVTDADSVEVAVAQATEIFGRLDVLISVAGGDTNHPTFGDTTDETWQRMFDLNLLGPVRVCRAVLPHLRASNRSPCIVLVSSINALTSFGSEPYSSAKAGLGSLTTNLAASLGPAGIRVNAVAPATIRTQVWDAQPGGADRLRGLYPLGRVGEPEDVAAVIAFLASDDACWITGHTLPVDGGLLSAAPSSSQHG